MGCIKSAPNVQINPSIVHTFKLLIKIIFFILTERFTIYSYPNFKRLKFPDNGGGLNPYISKKSNT